MVSLRKKEKSRKDGKLKLFHLDALSLTGYICAFTAFILGKFRALALVGASGRVRVVVSEKAGTRGSYRRRKVQWARQRVAVGCSKIPVVVEATRAGQEVVTDKMGGKGRSWGLGVDVLLGKRLRKGVWWASCAGRQ